jgi:hypothetical protein
MLWWLSRLPIRGSHGQHLPPSPLTLALSLARSLSLSLSHSKDFRHSEDMEIWNGKWLLSVYAALRQKELAGRPQRCQWPQQCQWPPMGS